MGVRILNSLSFPLTQTLAHFLSLSLWGSSQVELPMVLSNHSPRRSKAGGRKFILVRPRLVPVHHVDGSVTIALVGDWRCGVAAEPTQDKTVDDYLLPVRRRRRHRYVETHHQLVIDQPTKTEWVTNTALLIIYIAYCIVSSSSSFSSFSSSSSSSSTTSFKVFTLVFSSCVWFHSVFGLWLLVSFTFNFQVT